MRNTTTGRWNFEELDKLENKAKGGDKEAEEEAARRKKHRNTSQSILKVGQQIGQWIIVQRAMMDEITPEKMKREICYWVCKCKKCGSIVPKSESALLSYPYRCRECSRRVKEAKKKEKDAAFAAWLEERVANGPLA